MISEFLDSVTLAPEIQAFKEKSPEEKNRIAAIIARKQEEVQAALGTLKTKDFFVKDLSTIWGINAREKELKQVRLNRFIVDVEDADTLLLKRRGFFSAVKRLFGIDPEIQIRLAGIDAPEVAGHKDDPLELIRFAQEQPGGKQAAQELEEILKDSDDLSLAVSTGRRTYGRYLGVLGTESGENINLELLRRGAVSTLPYGTADADILPRWTAKDVEAEAIAEGRGLWQLKRYQALKTAAEEIGLPLTYNTLTRLDKLAQNNRLGQFASYLEEFGNQEGDLSEYEATMSRAFGKSLQKRYGPRWSGFDDQWNEIEGFQEQGLSSYLRKLNTAFGSGFKGEALRQYVYPGMYKVLKPGFWEELKVLDIVGFHGSQFTARGIARDLKEIKPRVLEKYYQDFLELREASQFTKQQGIPSFSLIGPEADIGTASHEALHSFIPGNIRISLGHLSKQIGKQYNLPKKTWWYSSPSLFLEETAAYKAEGETSFLSGIALSEPLETLLKRTHYSAINRARWFEDKSKKSSNWWFSGFDNAYNTIEGFPEGGLAADLRKIFTAFGSGYQGMDNTAERVVLDKLFSRPRGISFQPSFPGFDQWEKDYLLSRVKPASQTFSERRIQKGLQSRDLDIALEALLSPFDKQSVVRPFVKKLKRGKWINEIPRYARDWRVQLGAAALLGLPIPLAILFSGRDDAYNTIEGLGHEGMAGQLRRWNTDFGSGFIGRMVRLFRGQAEKTFGQKAGKVTRKLIQGGMGPEARVIEALAELVRREEFKTRPSRLTSSYWAASPTLAEQFAVGQGKGFLGSTTMPTDNLFASDWYYLRNAIWQAHGKTTGSLKQQVKTLRADPDIMESIRTYWQGLPIEGPYGAIEFSQSSETIEFLLPKATTPKKIYSVSKEGWKVPPKRKAGQAPGTQYKWKFETKFSGKDESYRTIDGFHEGGMASLSRKEKTPFGSGWDALRAIAREAIGITEKEFTEQAFRRYINSSSFQKAIQSGKVVQRGGKDVILGAGASGRALLMKTNLAIGQRNIPFQYVKKEFLNFPSVDTVRREALAMQTLQDFNAPSVYGFGTKTGDEHIFMELFEGTAIEDILRLGGRLTSKQVDELGNFLQVAARRGIAHGDLYRTLGKNASGQIQRAMSQADIFTLTDVSPSPANLMVTTQGNIGVLDFGLAQKADDIVTFGAGDVSSDYQYYLAHRGNQTRAQLDQILTESLRASSGSVPATHLAAVKGQSRKTRLSIAQKATQRQQGHAANRGGKMHSKYSSTIMLNSSDLQVI